MNDIQTDSTYSEQYDVESPEFFMGAIDFLNDRDNWNAHMCIEGVEILCKLDTGA